MKANEDERMKEVQCQGKYVGPVARLIGEKALVRHDPDSPAVLVQFDNLDLGPSYSHSWRQYPRSYWELFELPDGDDVDG